MKRFLRFGRFRLVAPGLALVALATWVLGAPGPEGSPKVGQRKEKAPEATRREPG